MAVSITKVASRQTGAACHYKLLALCCTQAFKEGDVRFLICTDVAARGIDIQVGAHLK